VAINYAHYLTPISSKMSNVSALWITIPPAIDDEPCPMKKELFQRPKLDSALEFLDLLRSTLPQEKYAAFLTLMLDVKEQRLFCFTLFYQETDHFSFSPVCLVSFCLLFSNLCDTTIEKQWPR
jgi:hypothetical protein